MQTAVIDTADLHALLSNLTRGLAITFCSHIASPFTFWTMCLDKGDAIKLAREWLALAQVDFNTLIKLNNSLRLG